MRAAALFVGTIAAGFLALAACSDSPETEAPVDAEGQPLPQLTIHRPFRAGPGSVNSYVLEGPDEVLVFDVQGDLELSRRVIARIEGLGKPVTAIVISHYHPDHFAGLAEFAEAFPDAQVVMAEAVADQIRNDPEGYVETLRQRGGEDFTELPEPDTIVEAGDTLEVSGVPVSVSIVESAEASPILMLSIPSQQAVLASDLVVNGMHPNMADANLDSWPRALERASRDFTGFTLYPGHGEPGPVNLLVANQTGYLNFMRSLVQNDLLEDDIATEAEITGAISEIRGNYPDWESTTGRPAQLRRNLEELVVQLGGRLDNPTRRATRQESDDREDNTDN